MSRSRGLSLYDGVSFMANFRHNPSGDGPYPLAAPVYVSLILYDRTDDVWISMLPATWPAASFSTPDVNGWRIVTPPSDKLWIAYAFEGYQWGGDPKTLSDWDKYFADSGLDVVVRKVNIQFGYVNPLYYTATWGTVYVDALSFAGRILDFEP